MNDAVHHKSFRLHAEIRAGLADLLQLINNDVAFDEERMSCKVTKIAELIQEFELSPALLDAHLSYYMETLTSKFIAFAGDDPKLVHVRSLLASLIYTFSKIRGHKAVINFLPCDVYSIPRLIDLTRSAQSDVEIFACLLWLCNLVLVPFPLDSIDPQLAQSLYNISLSSLEKQRNLSRNQVASLLLLCRLLTRSDVLLNHELFPGYFRVIENEWYVSGKSGNKLGHLVTISRLLKMCNFDVLKPYIPLVYNIISADMITAQAQLQSISVTLYSIKILGKLTLMHIQLGQFSKVSLIINNLLNEIVTSKLGSFDVSLRSAMAKSLSDVCSGLGVYAPNYRYQLLKYMLDLFSIENLDTDCPETFNPGLKIDPNNVDVSKFHFLLLFLGYATMKRSVPFSFVPALLSIVHRTLFLQQRGSAGDLFTPIRDSSCLVAWAICQTVSRRQCEELAQQNETILLTMLCDFILAAVTDTDLIIRKCAVAVVQELVGRYGQSIFCRFFTNNEKLGEFTVAIIELLDTHSLSNLVRSFALVSKFEKLGFDKRIFVPRLLQNIVDDSVAHDLRLLSLNCVADLYRGPEVISSVCPPLESRNVNIPSIIDMLINQPRDELFAICVLYPLSPGSRARSFIELAYESFEYTPADSIEKAYGYVKWISFKISEGAPPTTFEWDRLFRIASVTSHKHVKESFSELCSELGKYDHTLLIETIDSFERLIKRDSLIAAFSIFSVGNLSAPVLDRLFVMMTSKALNIDTREGLIQGLTRNISCYCLDENHLTRLILLLDDYTITSQGDVGLKLRIATIFLIRKSSMWQHGPDTNVLIRKKLLRLSGEIMDKVRLLAFELLNEIDGRVVPDIDQWSLSMYFDRLLKYYRDVVLRSNDHDLCCHFWSGYVFSVGSVSSPAMVSESSLVSLLGFETNLDEKETSFMLSNLTALLIPTPGESDRSTRCQMAALNTFVKLFEANIRFPTDFDYSVFFIRCYNLHINTTNTIRIGLVLKIFQNMISSTCPRSTRIKCAKRVIQLSFAAKDAKIRVMAAEILFEVLGDIKGDHSSSQMRLADIDWSMEIPALSEHRSAIESAVVSSIGE